MSGSQSSAITDLFFSTNIFIKPAAMVVLPEPPFPLMAIFIVTQKRKKNLYREDAKRDLSLYNPAASKTLGTNLSQPMGIICMPWHIGFNSLIKRAAISIDLACLSLVSCISLIRVSGTEIPATFSFIYLAIPADFSKTIPAMTVVLRCLVLERKFSKLFRSYTAWV